VRTTENPIAAHRSRTFLLHLSDPFGRNHVNVQRRNLDAAWVTTVPTVGNIILYYEKKNGRQWMTNWTIIAEFTAFQGLFLEIETARLQQKKNTRVVRKASSHFEYLENRSRGLDVTWEPVSGDLTVHPSIVTLPWG